MYSRTLSRLLFPFIIFFYTVQVSAQASPDRIEPPFWWAGMEDTSLQLMVHGEQIGLTEVLVSGKGVQLVNIHRTDNRNYLFIDLAIRRDCEPGTFDLIFEYQRAVVATYSYELRKRNEGSAMRKGVDNSDVIYLLMPDRFANGDPDNDDIGDMLEAADRDNPLGRHGGDIQGIMDHLDYLDQLGITALWINPLLENDMDSLSYHGYAITDYYQVDRRFGSNEDYNKLVRSCREKGIKVIMDMVFNHCGIRHWWFEDFPADDWIHQFPVYTHSNYRLETGLDPYASDFDKQLTITGWFDKTMPDLDQRNTFLANYLIQNSIWWVEYAGLEGIRMDTYPYSYKEFMDRWMERMQLEYPRFSILKETWLKKESHTAYLQGDHQPGSFTTAVTDFPLHDAMEAAFQETEGWMTGLRRLYYVLAQDFLYTDPMQTVVFADNHDVSRYYSVVGENIDRWKMAMAFLLTTRGIPMIYYGTEILMTGFEHTGHGYIREDFPGGWPGDERNAFTPLGRDSLENEAFYYLEKLLDWRKGKQVIHHGKLKQFIPEDGIYVYFRYDEQETVMVILNNNESSEVDIDLERYTEILGENREGYEVISGLNLQLQEELSVGPKSAMIIELRR